MQSTREFSIYWKLKNKNTSFLISFPWYGIDLFVSILQFNHFYIQIIINSIYRQYSSRFNDMANGKFPRNRMSCSKIKFSKNHQRINWIVDSYISCTMYYILHTIDHHHGHIEILRNTKIPVTMSLIRRVNYIFLEYQHKTRVYFSFLLFFLFDSSIAHPSLLTSPSHHRPISVLELLRCFFFFFLYFFFSRFLCRALLSFWQIEWKPLVIITKVWPRYYLWRENYSVDNSNGTQFRIFISNIVYGASRRRGQATRRMIEEWKQRP